MIWIMQVLWKINQPSNSQNTNYCWQSISSICKTTTPVGMRTVVDPVNNQTPLCK
jgi:hypothetical protein